MDVKSSEVFEELNQNTPTMSAMNDTPTFQTQKKLPLPDGDFDKNGKLKKVRSRMLKKLIKTEIQHYKMAYVFFSAFVLVLGIFFAILLRNDLQTPPQAKYQVNGLLILSGLMYVYAAGGFAIYAYIAPVHRYNKNFFKEEGYLTFSIPASMEEHVLAKRLTALFGSLVSGVIVILSILLTFLIVDGGSSLGEAALGFFEIFGGFFKSQPIHMVFLALEFSLMGLIGWMMMPCVFGAVSCALSKYTGKKKSGITILIIFIAVSILESLFITIATTDILLLFNSPVGIHVGLWIFILLQAGLTVGAFLFEIHYLKKKLDLK